MSDGNGALPEGWGEAKLNELAAPEPNSMTDGPFGSKLKTAHYVDSGVRVVRLGNIGVGQFENSVKAFITSEHFETIRKHEIFAGDLVIAALAEPVGRACAVPDYVGTAIVKADCIRFKPADSISSPFLMNWLNSPVATKNAEGMCHGIGRLRINMANMRELPIPVAPEAEQRRIVSKIESLQERSSRARRALSEVGPLLEQFRQSVLRAAFSGRLTADWRAARETERNSREGEAPAEPRTAETAESGGRGSCRAESGNHVETRIGSAGASPSHPSPSRFETAHELLQRIRTERRHRWEQSELAKYEAKGKQPPKNWQDNRYKEADTVDTKLTFDLPDGWCWATIDTTSFVTKLAGFEYTKFVNYEDDGDLAVIKAENAGPLGFRRTEFSRVHSNTVAHLTRSQVVADDVLMVFVGAGVGQVACLPDDQPYFLGPNISMIRIESSFLRSKYLEHFLRSPIGFDLAMSFTKAVAQPSLSMGTIRKIPVPIPPIEEQQEIATLIEAAIERVVEVESVLAESESALTQLDQSILAKAFRGELVPQDPRDEPASELLARIRTNRETAASKPKGGDRRKTRSKKSKSADPDDDTNGSPPPANNPQNIKVLTVKQPLADEIIFGKKWCENRSWPTRYRGPLFIHSSAAWDSDYERNVSAGNGETSAIIGRVDLVDIVDLENDGVDAVRQAARRHGLSVRKECMEYVNGELCWIVANPMPLETPIVTKGKLKIWTHSVDSSAIVFRDSRTPPTKILQPQELPFDTAKEPRSRTSTLDEFSTDEIMAEFRSAMWGEDELEEAELLRAVADRLGYGRLGKNIRAELKNHLRAAIMRRIIARDGDYVYCPTSIFRNYDRDVLLDSLKSVMLKNREYTREDVTHYVAIHLGFSNVTDAMRKHMKSVFNSAIRTGLLDYKGKYIWRTG